jgi:hypothetical protein
MMNGIRNFLVKAGKDNNIKPTHISLFIAVITIWEQNNRINPITIDREDIMMMSKINSKFTYHNCLNYLNSAGYLIYKPSFSPLIRSQIKIIEIKIKEPS